MYSENNDLGQVVQACLGRQIHQRLAFAGARERILEALEPILEAREHLANGEPVAAAHRIEAATDQMEAAVDQIEDGGREELAIIDALADFPPVFLIDAWLHGQRQNVLNKLAGNLGWTSAWVGEEFHATQDESGLDLHINATDGWRCTSGMSDMFVCGVGLTALHAHLKGQDLAATVARLAPWYLKTMKGGRV
ncbi:hypothetical protein [Rhizobium sp. NZLR1]|uniref:hypothetical protein n=1 Tax=Rhizobium sp. NZLR1 TaxID=2731096 RepID=UPI001A994D06|nr:hypothetical protein [Rhizobium sp. NZLR1]MBX5202231.1 hypothetical protein [Rhizobium sp. NZLR1]QSZ20855.1 hypothetical protein J3O30_21610 [Rhizobium sp. NZLR1]